MSYRKIVLFVMTMLIQRIRLEEETMLEIDGIEPNSGPLYGETRVLVRLNNFKDKYVNLYPQPKCKFGTNKMIVDATWVKCMNKPRGIGDIEVKISERNFTCIQCEFSPSTTKEDIVPLTVSLLGDFTDIKNSVPFRYYREPIIHWIYPRYGIKDGGTFVEVFGENFLNFDQNLKCGFGTQEVKAYYVNHNYLICYSPQSSIVEKRMPFSISLNNQQNTKQDISYIYFDWAQVASLSPNKGPDTGGTVVRIRGQNFNPSNRTNFHNYNDTFCRFGNLSLEVAQVVSSTEIICTSPPSFELREVPVEITLNNREWTQDGILFYYYHPPFVYAIFPKIGPVQGGTDVLITGSNFIDTGRILCRFGSIPTKGEYINENTLKCTSPKVEKPGYVNLAIAIREDEFSSGLGTKYLYFDIPVVNSISPICGPERGFTQITVRGKNFADTGSDYMKCVFDEKIFMNATRMSDTEIKCDSPSVLNYAGINENNVRFYTLTISLNGYDTHGPGQRFDYYKETHISSLEPIYGPTSGGTVVKISGGDFAQPGACNVTVRFSTYMVKPINYTNSTMYVSSPMSNFTGGVVVQVALNGKQFDKDIKVNFRDKENTFYYYKTPFVSLMKPLKGPTIGGTRVVIFGMNFDEVYYNDPNNENHIIYYRFVNALQRDKNPRLLGGAVYKTVLSSNNLIKLITPPVSIKDSVVSIELSYNNQNFFRIEEYNFTYFVLANITKVEPQYGPLKSKDFQEIIIKLDNYYCVDKCDDILCRFKSINNIFFEKGRYLGPNTVNCTVPRVNIPDIFNIEVSFNKGEEFTNNKKNFTFYDPYVTSVQPPMISSSGGTVIYIRGYGFADSGDNLKVRFGSRDNPLKCGTGSCIVKATYVNQNLITATTFGQDQITYLRDGRSIGYDRYPVEVSIYNDDFTNNNITFFYFDEPEAVKDIISSNKWNLSINEVESLKQSLVFSLPANVDTFVIIPVDSSKILRHLKSIGPYANYSCKFQNSNKTIYKITEGLLTSFPKNLDNSNIFLCQTPRWEEVGEFKVMISLNRFDFSESLWTVTFTDPINILRIEPSCGSIHGKTKMKIYGTGFEKSSDFVFKFGVQNMVPLSKSNFWEQVKESDISPIYQSKFKIQKLEIEVPPAPYNLKTYGGLDYISVAKITSFPSADIVSKYNPNNFIHTNLEYYYYKPQYIQSFSPQGSIITGGTVVLVVGAWFGYKPQYGYRPYCRFGDKIVEGQWLSTVRITCVSPPYTKANTKVSFDVSMNKYDFSSSGLLFTYYNDFTKAKFDSIEPTSGPDIGGTIVKLYGQNFTSLLNPDEFLCKFKPIDERMESKNVPAGYKEFADGKTAIICITPGGWASGTMASILITFDGQKFIDSNFNFYFYKIDKVLPLSGPNTGNGPIQILGGGFQNSTKVKCILAKSLRKPVYITQNNIGCQMVPAPSLNFTGRVDFEISLNGIDRKDIPQGFYYYIQPVVSSIFPNSGPNSGNALVKVFGSGFRKDFPGLQLGCKIGDFYGRGEYISEKELYCYFTRLPLIEKNHTLNVSIALNNYSFTQEVPSLNFTPYGIVSIEPSSGPISGGTEIIVKGAGFYESNNIRCSFGVRGYYQYTYAKFIDYNHIVCSSPENFVLPVAGQLPFSVPFSISMNDDLYNPWTESTHFFSFYENPVVNSVFPLEAKTTETKEVLITATIDKPFATPSAVIYEENIIDYSKEKTLVIKKSFAYQPIKCRFGRFGTSPAIYVNRTLIKCITPKIEDDSDISYEDVTIEIALNGVDFVENSDTVFTFQGPNAGRMLWVYILILLFIALIVGLIVYMASNYWDQIQSSLLDTGRRDVYSSDLPHVIQKQPRYLNPEYRPDLMRHNDQNQDQPNFQASNLIK